MPPLFEELAKDIEGELVADQKTIASYSVDQSPFMVQPQVIIYPKTTSDIEKIVSFGKTYRIPITVRGRGNGSKGGALSPGIIVDMHRYFDKLGKLTLQEARLTVQSGALYMDCAKRLEQWGYTLPYVDHEEDMTIGGMLATNYKSSTALSTGAISDWVESLRVVLDDGKEYLIDANISPHGRLLEIYGGTFSCLQEENEIIFSGHVGVVNQGMGYDVFTSHISPKMLMHFIIGSEGTLGIITEVTLRLDVKEKCTAGVALSILSIDDLPFVIDKLLTTHPVSMDGFDAKTLSLSHSKTNLTESRHSNDIFTLFAIYSGNTDSVERSLERTLKLLPLPAERKHLCDENQLKEYRGILFTQKNDLEKYAGGSLSCVSLCNDLVFPVASLNLALKELQSLCEEYRVIYSTTIHAGTGVIRIETLFDMSNPETGDIIIGMISQISHIVKWYRGAITYSYGDGIMNTPVLPVIYGADMGITLKKIKKVWDPNNIFNPGKKTTIDLSYVKKHINYREIKD